MLEDASCNIKHHIGAAAYNRIIPRRPRGFGAIQTIFYNCSGAFFNGELELGLTNSPFKPETMNFDLFPGQVWSLTYDVLNKHLHCHKMMQLCNAANIRNPF